MDKNLRIEFTVTKEKGSYTMCIPYAAPVDEVSASMNEIHDEIVKIAQENAAAAEEAQKAKEAAAHKEAGEE